MRRLSLVLALPVLVGCATQHPTVTSAPIPHDVGWSPPQVITEESPLQSPPPQPRLPTAAEQVIAYAEGQVDAVKVPVKAPLTLLLEPGEKIMSVLQERTIIPPGEEGSPWTIIDTTAETPARPVVGITVTTPGLTQGISVMTTKRIYLMDLKSVHASKTRLVRWEYGPPVVAVKAKPRLLPDPTERQTFYGGYELTVAQGSMPAWMPRQVVHDQRGKTYILFPSHVTAVSAPLLRLITSNGHEVVNYRVDPGGTVYILDGLFDMAELRLGSGEQAELVRITRGTPQAIACPGHDGCPVWPIQASGR